MRRRRDMPTPPRDLPWGSPRSLPAMPALRAHTESELQRQLLVAAVWTSLRRAEPLVECAVRARDRAVGPEIADESVHVVLLRLPRAQAVNRVGRDPDDLGVLEAVKVGVLVAQLTELLRARAGERVRIEHEHDV